MHKQGEYLYETLKNVLTKEPNKGTLNELLYTASECGLIENTGVEEAMIIYRIVELARSYNDEPLEEELRM